MMREITELSERLRNDLATRMDDDDVVSILEVLQVIDEKFWNINDANRKLDKQNQQYKKSLRFYADKENYKTNVVDQWEPIIPILKDVGKKARQTLEGQSCT